MFRLAYNTNGLAHHRPEDALRLLADLGYEGVALTPDVGGLDLYALEPRTVDGLASLADELGLELAIETGARYLMDPRRKHFPTLLEEHATDRARRVDFYQRSIDLASELGAEIVSLWSGVAPDGTPDEILWHRLTDGLLPVLEHGRDRNIRLAFEPEPGMFVERPVGYRELVRRLGDQGMELGLTLDVGHLIATGDLPGARGIGEQLSELADCLVHVHLDDAQPGIHEHLAFGKGVLHLPATLNGLLEIGYSGMAAVELSRDSHRGAAMAESTLEQLRTALSHRP
ncbi:MAG TPA: sugar phosphate isomerase/epimerase [Planctomycetota bacterium]|nr:sugar phosphate isomerase/epimerase [Planctomycetota bacterium]